MNDNMNLTSEQQEQMKKRMEAMTLEQQEQMKKRMESMTPEQMAEMSRKQETQRAMQEKMQQSGGKSVLGGKGSVAAKPKNFLGNAQTFVFLSWQAKGSVLYCYSVCNSCNSIQPYRTIYTFIVA